MTARELRLPRIGCFQLEAVVIVHQRKRKFLWRFGGGCCHVLRPKENEVLLLQFEAVVVVHHLGGCCCVCHHRKIVLSVDRHV